MAWFTKNTLVHVEKLVVNWVVVKIYFLVLIKQSNINKVATKTSFSNFKICIINVK